MRVQSQILIFLSLIILCGCTRSSGEQDNLNAVLWVQTSVEYTATTSGIYAAATAALQQTIAAEIDVPGRMVVVMDLDETILSNSRFKAHQLLQKSREQSKTWDQWIVLRNATAVPGAVEFIKASQELGVTVRIITNRRCLERPDDRDDCPQKEDSLANLRQVGVKIDGSAILMRGEQSPERCLGLLSGAEKEAGGWSTIDKTSRRECVSQDFDIMMMVGDQLGDFVGDSGRSTLASRDASLMQYQDKWGKTWFMLPNPTYGTWFMLLYPDRRAHLVGR